MIKSITQNSMPTAIKINSYPVFSSDPTQNAAEATQIQYAMSVDTASYGTAPTAAMSNGQEVIASPSGSWLTWATSVRVPFAPTAQSSKL